MNFSDPDFLPAGVPERTTGYRYDALVSRWHDGDTVYLDVDLGFGVWVHDRPIRLFGINCPELSTAAGKAALAFCQSEWPIGTHLILASVKDRPDKYGGRYLGTMFETGGGESINSKLVRLGFVKPWDGKGDKP